MQTKRHAVDWFKKPMEENMIMTDFFLTQSIGNKNLA